MTNKQILNKAINKAIENGYSSKEEWKLTKKILGLEYLLKRIDFDKPVYYSIIFSHDFAKTFWGKKYVCSDCGKQYKEAQRCLVTKRHSFSTMSWMFHLQQMVLEEEPLKYIEKFL